MADEAPRALHQRSRVLRAFVRCIGASWLSPYRHRMRQLLLNAVSGPGSPCGNSDSRMIEAARRRMHIDLAKCICPWPKLN